MGTASLCPSCSSVRVVVSGRGSRFLLCTRSSLDPRYPKYPTQPVIRCDAYQHRGEAEAGEQDAPEDRKAP